jgi:flagellar biosynthetic protein FliR
MHLTIASAQLVTLLLVSSRIFAWSVIAPPMATGGAPKTVKVMLSVALALVIVPRAQAHAPAAQFLPLVASLLEQVLVGAALGFLTRLLFTAIESAGSMIDMFSGYSAAAAYDPTTQASSTVFSHFYQLMATTLIFATDAHLLIFQGFLRTFDALPLDTAMSLTNVEHALGQSVTVMFVSALQIAGPLIVVLFIADMALGVLNRIAPQLNAFQMSFPIKIGLTLMLVGAGFTLLPNVVMQLANMANHMIGTVTG